jgi:hypothetical protein
VALRSDPLTHRRFRLNTIGSSGISVSRLEFSIKAGHIDRPHESTTSSHEPANCPK